MELELKEACSTGQPTWFLIEVHQEQPTRERKALTVANLWVQEAEEIVHTRWKYREEVWSPVCLEHIEEPKLARSKGTTEIWVGGKSASEVDQNCMLVRGELRFQLGVWLKRVDFR